MKYCVIAIALIIIACNGEPLSIPQPVETRWIDATTNSDTVITNVNNNPGILYYALKNWQSSADTNITHGYRSIAGRQADTVVVYTLGDPTNAQGPFICGNSVNNDTLKSQNFLDTLNPNPVRIYTKLK